MHLQAVLVTCLLATAVQSDDDLSISDNRSKVRLGAGDVCPKIRFRNGRVKIRSRGRVAKFSCSTGFEMVGKRFSTCVRGQWNNPPPVCVAPGCPAITRLMNGRVFEAYGKAMMMFECNPGYILRGSSSVYCDGFAWNTSVSTCDMAMEHAPLSCDFESDDLCGWTQDPVHDFDWRRQKFGTPSGHVGTGPSHDHTKGESQDGHYMYIEASSPRKENDTARLFSPVYTADLTQNGCFIFWYHMYGATSGFLRVLIKPETLPLKLAKEQFIRMGDQGNRWIRGTVPLPALYENFQIIIEGIRGSSYVSDTAIDDLKLTNMTECLATEPPPVESSDSDDQRRNLTGTCEGRCLESDEETEGCQCNAQCVSIGTCCLDYSEQCEAGNSVNSSDFLPFPEVTSSFELTSATSSLEAVTESTAGVTKIGISNVPTTLSSLSIRTMDSQLVSSMSDKQTIISKPEIMSSFASAEPSSKVMVSPPVVASDLSSLNSVVTLSSSLTSQSQSSSTRTFSISPSLVVIASSPLTQWKTFPSSSITPFSPSKSPLMSSSILSSSVETKSSKLSPFPEPTVSIIPTPTLPFVTSSRKTVSRMSSFSKSNVPVSSSVLLSTPALSSSLSTISSISIVPVVISKSVVIQTVPAFSPISSSLTSSFETTQNFILSSPGYTPTPPDGASSSAYSVGPDQSLFSNASSVATNSRSIIWASPVSTVSASSSEIVIPIPTVTTLNTKTPSWTRKVYPSARVTTKQPEVILKPESSKAERHPGLSTPAVAGVAAGVLVLLVIVGAASYRFYKHRKMRQDKLSDDSDVRFLKDGEVHMEFNEPSRVYNDSNM